TSDEAEHSDFLRASARVAVVDAKDAVVWTAVEPQEKVAIAQSARHQIGGEHLAAGEPRIEHASHRADRQRNRRSWPIPVDLLFLHKRAAAASIRATYCRARRASRTFAHPLRADFSMPARPLAAAAALAALCAGTALAQTTTAVSGQRPGRLIVRNAIV